MTSRSIKKGRTTTINGRKNGSRIYIDPDDFVLMRHRAFLTIPQAARALDVTTKTVLNWEQGKSRIPYAAYRVLKLKVGYVFDDEHFGDWFTRGNTLWSPEGRAFQPHELRYISHYFRMARMWLAERQAKPLKNNFNPTIPNGAASDVSPASDAASRATALMAGAEAVHRTSCDATPRRDTRSVKEPSQVYRENSLDFEKFLERLGIPA